ncbi:MAG: hypothetical protein K6A38_08540 [Lachnospiraceae bacterium]|nr:hypothetical protein [Lachnospiraceae bacterium]
MDHFMDSITRRFSSGDIIRANMEAEAAELDEAKGQIVLFENQMEKVDTALSDMRQINLKNIETAEDISKLTKDSTEKISRTIDDVSTESVSKIRETSDLSIAGINKTVEQSLAKIQEIQGEDTERVIRDSIKEILEKIDIIKSDLEESSHTDHVKIYRNVQASFVDELNRQSEEIKKVARKKGAMLPLSIITLIISISTLAVLVLHIFGIL